MSAVTRRREETSPRTGVPISPEPRVDNGNINYCNNKVTGSSKLLMRRGNSPRGFNMGKKSFTEEELVGRRPWGGSPLIVHLFERRKVFRGAEQQVLRGRAAEELPGVCVCVCT